MYDFNIVNADVEVIKEEKTQLMLTTMLRNLLKSLTHYHTGERRRKEELSPFVEILIVTEGDVQGWSLKVNYYSI